MSNTSARQKQSLGLAAPGFTFANVMDEPAAGASIGPYERLFERVAVGSPISSAAAD